MCKSFTFPLHDGDGGSKNYFDKPPQIVSIDPGHIALGFPFCL